MTPDSDSENAVSRRRCLMTLGLGAAGLVLPGCASKRPRGPNIVMIVADDLGSTDLGCYGAVDLRTPHIDALAGAGVRFTDHYVTAPACTPSRASLLTGREYVRAIQQNVGLEADEITLAEMLRPIGYRNAVFGKWHLGIPTQVSPLAQGFDEFLGFKVGALDNVTHNYRWGAGAGHRLWRNDRPHREDGAYFPDVVTRESVAFIERNREQPFFLYLPYNQPHYPLQPTAAALESVAHIEDHGRRQYAACVTVLDDAVGKIVGALADNGITQDTIVLFLSDHGHSTEPESLSGGRCPPYRGHKGTLLEGGIRVPCIAAWPGTYPAGAVRHQMVSSMDWVPTLADHAGLGTPSHVIDGQSLEDVIASPTGVGHDVLCWTYGNLWAIRQGRWKLLGEGHERMALYDLQSDPGESHDRLEEEPEVFRHLAEVRNRWAEGLRDDPTVRRELGI